MSFTNMKLSSDMYLHKNGFTEALSEIDSQGNYVGTKFEGMDAFQRQLERFGINQNSCVEDFFKCSDSAVLFPEYILRNIERGKDSATLDVFATTTVIDSMDYRGIHVDGEHISSNDALCELHEVSVSIGCKYEAIKFQKLNVFETCLQQLGRKAAQNETKLLCGFLKENSITLWGNTFKGAISEQFLRLGLDTVILNCKNGDFEGNEFEVNVVNDSCLKSCIGLKKSASIERVVHNKPEFDFEALINKDFLVPINFIEGYNILDPRTVAEGC